MWKAFFLPGAVSRKIKIIFWSILVLYAFTEVLFFTSEDLTADEAVHTSYGVRLLKGDPSKRPRTTDDSKMPVSALNALPRGVEQLLDPGLNKIDFGASDARTGRWITFLFSFFGLLIMFRWSSELYGAWSGLLSMTLLAFCPAWLGHSGLATTDAYSVTIFLFVFYFLWKHLTAPSWKYFLLFSISLGIAQIVKQTFLHLYICIFFLLIAYYILNNIQLSFRSLLVKVFVLAIINVLIINIGFLFYRTGQPLNEYHFASQLFNTVQQALSFMKNFPLPFPEPYLTGMDTVKYFDEMGGGYPESTFPIVSILGNKQQGVSYPYYYLATLFYKIPVPVLLFILCAMIMVFLKSNRLFFKQKETILLLPIGYFITVMSLLNNIQAGERHIIFLYAALFLLCGKIVAFPLKRKSVLLITGGITWMMISVFSYWGCFISYTNEFIVDKKFAYKKVGNANLDFGQGISAVLKYIDQHPDVKLLPSTPQKGKFLVSVTNYENGFGLRQPDWLQHYQPIAHIHHSILLIEVK